MRYWLTPIDIIVILLALLIIINVGDYEYKHRPFNSANTLQVYADFGGDIVEYQTKYNKLQQEGGYLQINGPCISACTYFLKLVNPAHVCATDNASFWFHGVYNGEGVFNPVITQWIMPMVYPQFVLDILKADGFDGTSDVDGQRWPVRIIPITREQLRIQRCES